MVRTLFGGGGGGGEIMPKYKEAPILPSNPIKSTICFHNSSGHSSSCYLGPTTHFLRLDYPTSFLLGQWYISSVVVLFIHWVPINVTDLFSAVVTTVQAYLLIAQIFSHSLHKAEK